MKIVHLTSATAVLLLLQTLACTPPTGTLPTIDRPGPFQVGGTVSGMNGGYIELNLRSSSGTWENIQIEEDGEFQFSHLFIPVRGLVTVPSTPPIFYETWEDVTYEVHLQNQPESDSLCEIENASGRNLSGNDVTDVSIICRVPRIANLRELVPDINLAICIDETGANSFATITSLDCSVTDTIYDTTGLQELTQLRHLDLRWALAPSVIDIDLGENTYLVELYLGKNSVENIDLSHNTSLRHIHIAENNLTDIDLSQNTALESLSAYDNRLESIDLGNNTALRELSLRENELNTLDLSANINLEELSVGYNNISSLDLGNNPELRVVWASYNQLTQFQFGYHPNLETLTLYRNLLATINLDTLPSLMRVSLGDNPFDEATETYLDSLTIEDLTYDDNY